MESFNLSNPSFPVFAGFDSLAVEAKFTPGIYLGESMMDARRRTLASEGPLGNALPHSSIPVPSSVMKKPAVRSLAGSRMSMAPSHFQTNLAANQYINRQSTMPSNGGLGMSHSSSQEGFQRRSTLAPNRGDGGHAQGTMSGSRGDGGMYGRTPQTMRSVPSRWVISFPMSRSAHGYTARDEAPFTPLAGNP